MTSGWEDDWAYSLIHETCTEDNRRPKMGLCGDNVRKEVKSLLHSGQVNKKKMKEKKQKIQTRLVN